MDKTYPQIEREIKQSRWITHPDGIEMDGETVFARLNRMGVVTDWRHMTDIPIGGCIKTGVSAYERVR